MLLQMPTMNSINSAKMASSNAVSSTSNLPYRTGPGTNSNLTPLIYSDYIIYKFLSLCPEIFMAQRKHNKFAFAWKQDEVLVERSVTDDFINIKVLPTDN